MSTNKLEADLLGLLVPFQLPGVLVSEEWFYSAGETRHGPIPEERLKAMAAEGELKPSDLVWKDGTPDWVEARTIPGLFSKPTESTQRRPRSPLDESDPDDRRPRRRQRRQDDDDDDDDRLRSSRRRGRETAELYGDDRDDFDDTRRSSYRSREPKPGPVTAAGIMMLVGGILGLLAMLGAMASSWGVCCFWPGLYFEIVVCILMIVRATNMMNLDNLGPPKGLAICQICFVLNVDFLNMTLGIITLVMRSGDEATRYYRKKGF